MLAAILFRRGARPASGREGLTELNANLEPLSSPAYLTRTGRLTASGLHRRQLAYACRYRIAIVIASG
jgi:hypothetical protein